LIPALFADLSDFFEFLFRLGLIGCMLVRMPLDSALAVSLDIQQHQQINSKRKRTDQHVGRRMRSGGSFGWIFRKGLDARRTFLI
jgi:ribosomal 50S subunit-associated protein YjgA (DUF615 family)